MKATDRSTFSDEIVHEEFCQLAVSEGNNREPPLDVSGINTMACSSKTPSNGTLVRSHGFHTLTQNHERFVDVARFS